MPGFANRLLGRWSTPLFPVPASLVAPLGVVALLLRVFAGGLTGIILIALGLKSLGFLSNPGFIPYGYDKLIGNNVQYGMDAGFFRGIGVPMPELTQIMIGALEFLGGLALVLGLLTRLFAFLLAGNMLVALITAGDASAEMPLFLACALLVVLGGGLLSVDQVLDRRMANRAAPLRVATTTTTTRTGP